ncbi:MAG: ATP-binding protein [Kiritimatiellaeota bacterium]|nr:ATP-binding protein [Kiritimatiellota bacterium]
MKAQYQRQLYPTLLKRMREPRRFLQVLAGPRQVGKTTLARQVANELDIPVHYASADEPTLQDRAWLNQQWDIARALTRQMPRTHPALLIVDEVQKVPGWSETIKRLWDEDSAAAAPLRVLLSGSSPLLVQQGLTESLAGRFEIIPVPHWAYTEMKAAFGWSVEQYVYFGGYPGAAALIADENRWRRYIVDALIETTIARDILLLSRVDKPALLRRLFHLGCDYSGQVLSYQKMLGQLQDAGNTVTLAHYLDLLKGAGLLAGLSKYAGQKVRQRGSSPKFQVFNTALMTALAHTAFARIHSERDHWGRLVESAVGAHLINSTVGTEIEVQYWLDRNREVDYVLCAGESVTAIEVKSGRRETMLPGMTAFAKAFPGKRQLLVGAQGIPLEDFLTQPAAHWLA